MPQGAKPLVGGTTKDKTVKALGDVTQTHGGISRRTSQDVKSPNNTSVRSKGKESTSARDRVRDWERERERLREMTRLEEVEREKEEEAEREKGQAKVKKQRKNSIKELEENKENHGNVAFSDTMLPLPAITSPLTQGELPPLRLFRYLVSSLSWLLTFNSPSFEFIPQQHGNTDSSDKLTKQEDWPCYQSFNR